MKLIKRYAVLMLLLSAVSNPLTAGEMRIEKTNTATMRMQSNAKAYKAEAAAVDGVTSPSKLRAIRSHSAAAENETKLTVFLGLLVIAIVVFFAIKFGDRK